ncbi:MAG: hypothetical protein ACRDSL_24075 [Pseudonocardiaceae bacterium]
MTRPFCGLPAAQVHPAAGRPGCCDAAGQAEEPASGQRAHRAPRQLRRGVRAPRRQTQIVNSTVPVTTATPSGMC